MKHTLTRPGGLACVGLATVALFIAGCSGSSTTNSGSTGDSNGSLASAAGLVPQSRPPIPDIPVPVGFKMAESISRDYESAGARYVDHTYEGYADKQLVDRFYATQMPLKDWTMRGRQMVRGEYILRFEKGTEFAEVRINSESTFTGTRTTINVNVQTLGRGDPRK